MDGNTSEISVKEKRLAREEAFRTLFIADQGVSPVSEVLKVEEEECGLEPATWRFARELAIGAWTNRLDIDPKLDELAIGWSLERMASADRALLRLAAYELMYRDDIPAPISINDAVELAKRYGSDESPRFINGILGNLVRRGAGAPTIEVAPPREQDADEPKAEDAE